MKHILFIPNTKLEDYCWISLAEEDLSKHQVDPSNHISLSNYIENQTKINKATYAVGGYLEKRNLYANSSLFNQYETRNIHLGIDLWAPAKTEICSPLSGKVVASHYNEGVGNYGGTIILKHTQNEKIFYSLFGHLSKESLRQNPKGKHVEANQAFCELGDETENGGYVPHLHYQILLKLLNYTNDFPGVCSVLQIDNFSKICPNPNEFLKYDIN